MDLVIYNNCKSSLPCTWTDITRGIVSLLIFFFYKKQILFVCFIKIPVVFITVFDSVKLLIIINFRLDIQVSAFFM